MANNVYEIDITGFQDLQDELGNLPNKITANARQAVNATARRTLTQASRLMRQQVNFAARYLTGPDGRLNITKPATNSDLSTSIKGRFRPTSLATFSPDKDPKLTLKRGGTRVQVKPGDTKFMKNAFLIRLRRGNQLTDTLFNQGLALRLKPGESIRNKRAMVQIAKGLYLLYGPSVDQVFRSIAAQLQPEAQDFLVKEFNRLRGLDNVV